MRTAAVRRTLETRLGWTVEAIHPVVGGDLNDAYRVEITGDGDRFVKSSEHAAAGAFAAEAAGLRWLAEPDGGVPAPRVHGWYDPPAGEPLAGDARLLALEWVEPAPLRAPAAEELGRALARTHAAGAPAFGATPWPGGGPAGIDLTHRPSHLGPVTLPNAPARTFAEFYASQRLAVLIDLADQHGALRAAQAAELHALLDRLPQLCGPDEPPARCHGDLWTGNVLAGDDGVARLIDPAAHGGHREVDLAVLRLFGAPPPELFAAYDEVHPLAGGWQERVPLFQLGTVLLHVVLFGGGYVESALRIARAYA